MLGRLETAMARRRLRRARADNLPYPDLPEGTVALPQIEHIVVLMMENHSYDNYFGMLTGRGDGLDVGADGRPVATNPATDGATIPLRHAASTKQQPDVPNQSWHGTHLQWDGGACDGFVRSIERVLPGKDATAGMRYWTEQDLPFYYGLARTFPLATRWFSSCLGPTFPNRRFLIAGTAHGLIDDSTFAMIDYPASGTILDRLGAHGISWANYHQLTPLLVRRRQGLRAPLLARLRLLLPLLAQVAPQLLPAVESKLQVTSDLFPLDLLRSIRHLRPIEQFFRDAAAGTLPAVTVVDPDFNSSSEENPQDIQVGEGFSAAVINAVMHGPGWPKTVLVWLYDEHGGYYDHVPPPAAPAPDDVPGRSPLQRFPLLRLLSTTAFGKRIAAFDAGPCSYDRLGFRVPAVIVSPYARPDHVTDRVYDHTSVLKLIERVWNLPPLTRRDAAAADPLDALDLDGPPRFLTPPRLPEPARPWRPPSG